MYVLLDLTNVAVIARHEEYLALAALAVIQYPNCDCTIVPCVGPDHKGESPWAFLSGGDLVVMGRKLGGKFKVEQFGVNWPQFRDLVNDQTPQLQLPFTKDNLVAQAMKLIFEKDNTPHAVTDGVVAKPLDKWHADPQIKVNRTDSHYGFMLETKVATHMATHRAIAPAGEEPTFYPTPPRSRSRTGVQLSDLYDAERGDAPSGRTQRTPKPRAGAGATTTPREPRAPSSGPATRPKAGTSTGKVWDHADRLAATGLQDKELRKAVIAACEADDINGSTASVQFGKWKSAQ